MKLISVFASYMILGSELICAHAQSLITEDLPSYDEIQSPTVLKTNKTDDPCWRKFNGYMYVYEDTQPKTVPASVDGEVLNLGGNEIPIGKIALPLIPMATDPRCFAIGQQGSKVPISACCSNMQCRAAWIHGITQSVGT